MKSPGFSKICHGFLSKTYDQPRPAINNLTLIFKSVHITVIFSTAQAVVELKLILLLYAKSSD